MLHKNTVQYRIRKAEESLGRPVGEHQHDVELALRTSRWLARPCCSRPENDHKTGVIGPAGDATGPPGWAARERPPLGDSRDNPLTD
jgi:hypothetical protein